MTFRTPTITKRDKQTLARLSVNERAEAEAAVANLLNEIERAAGAATSTLARKACVELQAHEYSLLRQRCFAGNTPLRIIFLRRLQERFGPSFKLKVTKRLTLDNTTPPEATARWRVCPCIEIKV